ncbi:hypothetical protein [Nocardia nepalensis]|uniref:hypothetical protein n=1 Tax=Nocardia nepalensis TaxID=3375448 RepID=UPI003B683E7F
MTSSAITAQIVTAARPASSSRLLRRCRLAASRDRPTRVDAAAGFGVSVVGQPVPRFLAGGASSSGGMTSVTTSGGSFAPDAVAVRLFAVPAMSSTTGEAGDRRVLPDVRGGASALAAGVLDVRGGASALRPAGVLDVRGGASALRPAGMPDVRGGASAFRPAGLLDVRGSASAFRPAGLLDVRGGASALRPAGLPDVRGGASAWRAGAALDLRGGMSACRVGSADRDEADSGGFGAAVSERRFAWVAGASGGAAAPRLRPERSLSTF